MSTFSVRLKLARDAKKLSQQYMADFYGITRSAYSAWEIGRNEPPFAFIEKFCKTFHISADYLLGLSDIMEPAEPVSIKPAIVKRDSLDDLLPEFREEAEKYLKYLRAQQDDFVKSKKQEA